MEAGRIRASALCRTMWSVGANEIATRLSYIRPPALVRDGAGYQSQVSLTLASAHWNNRNLCYWLCLQCVVFRFFGRKGGFIICFSDTYLLYVSTCLLISAMPLRLRHPMCPHVYGGCRQPSITMFVTWHSCASSATNHFSALWRTIRSDDGRLVNFFSDDGAVDDVAGSSYSPH